MIDEFDWNKFKNKIMGMFDRIEELEKENEVLQRHFEEGQKKIGGLEEKIYELESNAESDALERKEWE